mmetsp:Transcript_27545/g.59294  ORF Transcript_27545/g.59294 Transcript_27545/m.59294 type:complete len:82 (+) Transcript_27545:241-486(+)
MQLSSRYFLLTLAPLHRCPFHLLQPPSSFSRFCLLHASFAFRLFLPLLYLLEFKCTLLQYAGPSSSAMPSPGCLNTQDFLA